MNDLEPDHWTESEPPDSFARLVSWLRVTVGYSADEDDRAEDPLAADRSRRWTSRSILVVVALLAVFNAHSLVSWASTLPPNWGSATLRDLSRVWETRLGEVGLNGPARFIHEQYQGLKSFRWP